MSRYLSPSNEPNEQVTNSLSRIEGVLVDMYVMIQDLQTKNNQLEAQLATLVSGSTSPTETPTSEETPPTQE